MKVRIS